MAVVNAIVSSVLMLGTCVALYYTWGVMRELKEAQRGVANSLQSLMVILKIEHETLEVVRDLRAEKDQTV